MQRLVKNTISECIGNTPLLRFNIENYASEILFKFEKFNPNGSMKDRMALNMVEDAEQAGLLKPGDTIVESTSGNTGAGLAMVAAEKGYKFVAIVDGHAAKDKIKMMKAYGAEIIVVNEGADSDSTLATSKRDKTAEEMAQNNPRVYWTKQHDNRANSAAYEHTLAWELLQASHGWIDALIGAVGTGGSLCGTARGLKAEIPAMKVIGVEPEGSIIFGGESKPYYQSGTGTPAGARIGDVVEYHLIDVQTKVSDCAAFNTARYFAKRHGILVGGSAGGVIYSALQYIKSKRTPVRMAAIVADGGEKYLDTVFNDAWMAEKSLLNSEIEQEIIEIVEN